VREGPRRHAAEARTDGCDIIQNIVRHMHMGKSPYRAALADEIGLAVIAITLRSLPSFCVSRRRRI
jgi:hypothetical protein